MIFTIDTPTNHQYTEKEGDCQWWSKIEQLASVLSVLYPGALTFESSTASNRI